MGAASRAPLADAGAESRTSTHRSDALSMVVGSGRQRLTSRGRETFAELMDCSSVVLGGRAREQSSVGLPQRTQRG